MTTPTASIERLTLTAAERQIILEEYDSYPRGDARRGALLRRYGLYTSQMAKWRERLKRGRPANLADELEAIARRCDALPILDHRSADEILGYDENGLPS